jgi:glycosyltransferase involved in cell wall biosynthesis
VAEAAGDAVLYADDHASLITAMTEVAEHPERRAELRAQSLARAAQFSWERTARLTHDVYLEAVKRFGK